MSPAQRTISSLGSLDGVIVSIEARWKPTFEQANIRAIIRRRVPSEPVGSLYLHFNAPISAIGAKCNVSSISRISLDAAISQKDDLAMQEADIVAYFGSRKQVGLYRFDAPIVASRPLRARDPPVTFSYYPQPNFQRIDADECRAIDAYIFRTTE